MTTGSSIRQRREGLLMTQEEVGRLVGLTSAGVSTAERGKGSQPLIARIDAALTAKERERAHLRAEEARIAGNRALAATMPDGEAWTALKTAILDRALKAMDDAQGEITDALLEFIPGVEVDRFWEDWEREQWPESPPGGPGDA